MVSFRSTACWSPEPQINTKSYLCLTRPSICIAVAAGSAFAVSLRAWIIPEFPWIPSLLSHHPPTAPLDPHSSLISLLGTHSLLYWPAFWQRRLSPGDLRHRFYRQRWAACFLLHFLVISPSSTSNYSRKQQKYKIENEILMAKQCGFVVNSKNCQTGLLALVLFLSRSFICYKKWWNLLERVKSRSKWFKRHITGCYQQGNYVSEGTFWWIFIRW